MKKENIILTVLIFTTLFLIFYKIWLSVSIADMAYDYEKIKKEINVQQSLNRKLEAERAFLRSPARLKKMASKFGFRAPKEGEVRVLAK
ncbi:cell division protein FtsL [Desulfonauticus submarinus]|uniref:Cell division protein FtsL n=1 Tax=Desulfonauticus submarinus TaxID=206665 RepID=A0A1H0CUF3_9BACT|nr:hypothetical protein [Desulfonauticus submarinus]SDN61507.1 cell division protein FtsL [Desulfonauticus submarinus]